MAPSLKFIKQVMLANWRGSLMPFATNTMKSHIFNLYLDLRLLKTGDTYCIH